VFFIDFALMGTDWCVGCAWADPSALKLVESLPNPNCKGTKGRPCKRGRDNYSKLAAFGMTEYRTLVSFLFRSAHFDAVYVVRLRFFMFDL
jgi:thiol-disulfide isomerase/thioredoxin